jgi:hypothetical protein
LSVNGYSDGLDQVWIDNKGRALDDYFAYRLYKLHNNNFKFIKSNKSFVYHAVSLNSKKLNLNYGNSGVNAFKDRAGIALKEFYSLIEIK